MVTKFYKLGMEHPAAALGGNENVTFFKDENSGDIFFNDAPAFLYSPGDCENETDLKSLAEGDENVQKSWTAFSNQEVRV